MIVSITLTSLSYFNISELCVCFLFQFLFLFIFYFSFWVVCGSQCHSWNDSVLDILLLSLGFYIISLVFLKSLVSLIFNLPLFFVSMFQYHSWRIVHPTYNNARLHHPLSSPLIDYRGMIRCPSINITLSLCMHFCLMISFMGFGMRLGDGGRGVDDKSGISCGFGPLLSKISNLVFDSSLQNFRPEFVHHSCSRALGQGHWVVETSGFLNF